MGKYQKYAEYQDSGVEWLGEIPSHWDFTKYKFIAKIFNGDSLSVDKKEEFSSYNLNDLAYISSKDIDINTLQVNYINGLRIPRNYAYKVAPKKSTLICIEGGSAGRKIAYINQEVCFVNKLACIYSSYFNNKFIYYLLQSILFKTQFVASLSGLIGGVSINDLGNFLLVVPTINEIEKIVKFLDIETAKIDTLIAEQEKLIELLKEKRQAVISHAVTKGLNPDVAMKDSGVEWLEQVPEHWTIPQIGYHAEVTKLTGFEYTNLWMPQEDGKIIALRGFNIQERYLDLNKTERISKNLSSKLFRSKLFKGDLVLPCTGTLGNAALIESDDTFHINQNIAKVTFDKRLFVPEFCLYWVTSQPFRQMIDFNNTSGMQPVLLIGDIRKLPIPLCSIDEQIKIVAYLDNQTQKMGELIRKAESAIQLMQERRTALISAAVNGKIDVRNWQNPTEAKMEFSA